MFQRVPTDLCLLTSDLCLLTSTLVERPLQITLFMQNEPNLVRRRRIANERNFFYNNELRTKNYERCQ